MASKTKHVGMLLLTGIVLAVAAIYALPMQQAAMACGGGCDGGGKKGGGGDCCGGSLVSVQDNNIGNVKDNDIKFLNHNKILSNNQIKDINVLSKNGEVNVLSKNYNEFLNNILSENGNNNNVVVNDVANDLHNNIVKHNNIGTSVLSDYFKQICGC
jgi:hypothetical protein